MRPARLLPALALLLAGCAAPASLDPPPVSEEGEPWWVRALVAGHDHTDPDAHAGVTTPNFVPVGWSPLVSASYGTTVQGALCGDVGERDGRRLAAVQQRGDVVLAVADVTDAANPQWLGELVMRTTYVYDVAVVADGTHVALVTSNHKTPEQGLALGGPVASWRSPCTGGAWVDVGGAAQVLDELVPQPGALLLVSLADPAKPEIVDRRPLGGYGHGVSSTEIDGRTWVVATALAGGQGNYPAPAASAHFYELDGSRLDLLGVYAGRVDEDRDQQPLHNFHNDAWVQKHPATGATLAWLAWWDDGLVMLDLADPARPREVGRWTDHDPALPPDDSGNVHSVVPLRELRDGRHYTLIGPELTGKPTNGPTGRIHVLDTTDPAKPFEVAAWTLPLDVTWEGRLMFSPHYLSVVGDTAFVSMYHGGVWALALSGIGGPFHVLPSAGVWMPTEVSPAPPARPIRWAPTLEEALALEDGTLVTFDSNNGLHTARFDPSVPVPRPDPWPLEPADART